MTSVRVPTRENTKPGEHYGSDSGCIYRRSPTREGVDDIVAETYIWDGDQSDEAYLSQAQRIAALLNGSAWKATRAELIGELAKKSGAYAAEMAQQIMLGALRIGMDDDYSELEQRLAVKLRKEYLVWHEEATR